MYYKSGFTRWAVFISIFVILLRAYFTHLRKTKCLDACLTIRFYRGWSRETRFAAEQIFLSHLRWSEQVRSKALQENLYPLPLPVPNKSTICTRGQKVVCLQVQIQSFALYLHLFGYKSKIWSPPVKGMAMHFTALRTRVALSPYGGSATRIQIEDL